MCASVVFTNSRAEKIFYCLLFVFENVYDVNESVAESIKCIFRNRH